MESSCWLPLVSSSCQSFCNYSSRRSFLSVPGWAFSFLGQITWALVIAAGAVIGMLVGTRILQAHVSTRGAKLLTLWGVVAIASGMVLQALLVSLVLQPNEAGRDMRFLSQFLGQLLGSVGVLVNVGAAMLALAFVARLRH